MKLISENEVYFQEIVITFNIDICNHLGKKFRDFNFSKNKKQTNNKQPYGIKCGGSVLSTGQYTGTGLLGKYGKYHC